MTDYIKCTRIKKELRHGSCNFDVRDQKGRAVGYKYTVHEITHTPAQPGEENGFWSVEIGAPLHVFEAWSSPTRDGVRYGPHNAATVRTLAEALALIDKRVKAARRREVKRFAPTVLAEMERTLGALLLPKR